MLGKRTSGLQSPMKSRKSTDMCQPRQENHNINDVNDICHSIPAPSGGPSRRPFVGKTVPALSSTQQSAHTFTASSGVRMQSQPPPSGPTNVLDAALKTGERPPRQGLSSGPTGAFSNSRTGSLPFGLGLKAKAARPNNGKPFTVFQKKKILLIILFYCSTPPSSARIVGGGHMSPAFPPSKEI